MKTKQQANKHTTNTQQTDNKQTDHKERKYPLLGCFVNNFSWSRKSSIFLL